MRKTELILVFFLSFILSTVPKTLNYQGKLLDSEGVGVNSTLDITFRLYTSESGGTEIWEQTISDVVISRGLFSVELADFPEEVNFSEQYYLEIQAGAEILSPREKLTSSPYSIRAGNVDRAVQSLHTSENPLERTGRLVFRGSDGVTISDDGDSILVVFSGASSITNSDFTLDINQTSISVYRGSDVTNEVSIINLTPGFTEEISLSVMGLPSGVSATFSPASCIPHCPSIITISTSEFTPPGTYTISVIGTNGEVVRKANFNLTINIPFDYTLIVSPVSAEIDQGDTTTTNVTANLLEGFPEEVSFSVSGLPPGALATFNPTSCILSCSATMKITTSPGTPAGTSVCYVTAMTSSGVVITSPFTLTVNYFEYNLTATPPSESIVQGNSTTTQIEAVRMSDVPQAVDFSLFPNPMHTGITANLTSSSCTPDCNFELNISSEPDVISGEYNIDIVGIGVEGGSVDTVTYILNVTPFDFSMALSPSFGSLISTGGEVISTISTTLNSEITQSVIFSHSFLPSGVTVFFNPASHNPSNTSLLTFNTSEATPGNYSIDIIGTAVGGTSRTQTYTLTVCGTPSAPQNLTANLVSGNIELNWSAPNDPLCVGTITNYNIYRRTDEEPIELVGTVGSVLTFTDTEVSGSDIFYYTVRVVNGVGESPSSNEVSATLGILSATGGNEIYNWTDTGTDITYRIHKFTTVGNQTFSVEGNGNVEVLIVAGGGGGGNTFAGGGGGGGVIHDTTYFVSEAEPVTVTVGGGGSCASDPQGVSGTNGSNSAFGTLIAIGGGGGGGQGHTGLNGGSGGGGAAISYIGGMGTTGQGYAGGSAGSFNAGGGGGGYSSVGGNAYGTQNAGNGGTGYTTNISGSSQSYAGGGGGGSNWAGTYGLGVDGGANGMGSDGTAPSAPANRGGGGGGGGWTTRSPGGNGGSGIVIVRYPIL